MKCKECGEEIRPHTDLDGSIVGYLHVDRQVEWNSNHRAAPDPQEAGR